MATIHLLVHERIVEDSAIMGGKPVVKGTRIPVERVLAHLAHTPDLDDLFAAYPELTLEDVQACLEVARAVLVDHSGGEPSPTDTPSPE